MKYRINKTLNEAVEDNGNLGVSFRQGDWKNGTESQYKEIIEAKEAEELANKTYVEKRLEEYGTWTEQFEYLVENGSDALKKRAEEIKAKYPKE